MQQLGQVNSRCTNREITTDANKIYYAYNIVRHFNCRGYNLISIYRVPIYIFMVQLKCILLLALIVSGDRRLQAYHKKGYPVILPARFITILSLRIDFVICI